ncbi:MAG: phosphatidylserine decarboxylase [Alphaproteobacteria bacterium]|nr:MAG: phosphatidylserine decarboxylase [Alphaproteobacteria bacterium]TAF15856.1 MAG: phosphatidylserine decarboxylase [Alphaproteobacteria bacterium]TAF41113.1 MAG: phosphatidylserine decarboxylase [Alphaproteobacteria bacterium]TAF77246.1 MAG: phosphatidylserine decarboxylase [Alphaproteobacteria bacterium]
MSIIATTKQTLCVGTHPKGKPFIFGFLFLSALGYAFYTPVGCLFLVLSIFSLYFFRNPDRMVPQGDGFVVASGDGIVCDIVEQVMLPKELGMQDMGANYTRISIFLNVFNVHVNRVPVSGDILKKIYIPGKFLNAAEDKSSDENERSIVAVRTEHGDILSFVQIAGFVARRIVCELHDGQKITQGDRYGIIRFGSRCDIYVPSHYKVHVARDSVAVGGETIIAFNPQHYAPEQMSWIKN